MSFTKSKYITILGLIAFLIISFWGLCSMHNNEQGRMGNCPFINGSASLCQMSVTEHINQWQQLFTVTQAKSLLLFLMVFLLIALFSINRKINRKAYNKPLLQWFHNYLYQHKPEIKLFNHFLVAFSRGILHSRVYA